MQLSIVTTLYQSAPYIPEFYRRITKAAQEITDSYEIILVNDGSPDESLAVALEIQRIDQHVKIVDLSRNFGQHKAIMTGLSYTTGEKVFLIDSDLEETPEWLNAFWHQAHEEQCDVVYGVQQRRKGGWFERISGTVFYILIAKLVKENVPRNVVICRLMSRRYVNALLLFREQEVWLAAILHITGFNQQPRIVTKLSHSPTTYNLKHKLAMAVNSITSFSNKPLLYIFYAGLLISIAAGGITGVVLIRWLFFSTPLAGWTSLICSIWLLGGMMITFIGIIGIYLSKIFSETKDRPYTIVREVYGE